MFKALAASVAAIVCLITPQASARGVIGTWQPCGFAAKGAQTTVMKCRQTQLRADVFRLDWADGKADIFIEMNNGTIQDSRGGLWLSDLHSMESGIYRSAYSVNSGMRITWRVFAATSY